MAHYRLKNNLNIGATFTVDTGVPVTPLGWNYAYGNAGEIVLAPRGAGGRMPTTENLSLHFDYPINVTTSSLKTVQLSLDLFNLWNAQRGVDYDPNYEIGGSVAGQAGVNTPACPTCANPDYGQATTHQAPFTTQFAIRALF